MIHQVYGMTVDRVIQIDSYKKFVRWLEEKEKVTIVIVDAVEMGFTESELFKYFDKTSNQYLNSKIVLLNNISKNSIAVDAENDKQVDSIVKQAEFLF